ncbi:MAG: tRNA preQ1(34) S-adenosylmethionine ribosyltransferase-isomerase QueA [Synergistaceae bacterium]|nr:tRNA preQ1(34) S-adenosylmethionine ribosyltransferase-isomerase QueA [Synergistaceae bacterium]
MGRNGYGRTGLHRREDTRSLLSRHIGKEDKVKRISHENLYDLSSYDYELPPENIAQTPSDPRDSSRLLVWNVKENSTASRHFRDITEYFRAGDVLVLNDTRVIPARLTGFRETGGKFELLLLRNTTADFLNWEALVKPARRIHKGDTLTLSGHEVIITDDLPEGIRALRFNFESRDDFMKFLEEAGNVPLPPYIHGDNSMKESYQTVFARNDGSSAAPTASLHFTPELLAKIQSMGVKIGYVTLHVGLGTFRPVKTQDIREHSIHTEHCEVPPETAELIRECRLNGGRVIASGTTSARTLESFADVEGFVKSGVKDTGLFIYPGYRFKVVDALITNFHLPQSSLIMLVSSFAANKAGAFGHEEEILERLIEIYEGAAEEGWRFFSFGDAMFIY